MLLRALKLSGFIGRMGFSPALALRAAVFLDLIRDVL